jgi:hypothetical protein
MPSFDWAVDERQARSDAKPLGRPQHFIANLSEPLTSASALSPDRCIVGGLLERSGVDPNQWARPAAGKVRCAARERTLNCRLMSGRIWPGPVFRRNPAFRHI